MEFCHCRDCRHIVLVCAEHVLAAGVLDVFVHKAAAQFVCVFVEFRADKFQGAFDNFCDFDCGELPAEELALQFLNAIQMSILQPKLLQVQSSKLKQLPMQLKFLSLQITSDVVAEVVVHKDGVVVAADHSVVAAADHNDDVEVVAVVHSVVVAADHKDFLFRHCRCLLLNRLLQLSVLFRRLRLLLL